MLTPRNATRSTLISTTRTLLQRASAARDIPALLPPLEEVELALALLEERHDAATLAEDRFNVQVPLALESEEVLDRQVMLFSKRLKGEEAGGDAVAEAAVRTLFPHGASDITRHSGRAQLTAYRTLRTRLEVTPVPAGLAAEPARITAGIDGFAMILLAKEQHQLQRREARREAAAAEAALRRSLTLLENNAVFYLGDEVMAEWAEPVRALSRRSAPPATISA